MPEHTDIRDIDVIAPNFKRRLSGVTSTIIQLLPAQTKLGLRIAALGPGLPEHLPRIRYRDLWRLWRPPEKSARRVWHARRNPEMLAGIVLRDLLRMPLALVFTSAAQRHHTRYTKTLIRQMDAVIATSRKSASYLEVPCEVVMHGIDTGRFTPPENRDDARKTLGLSTDTHIVGCFGRIRHQKGTDVFVDAMIRLLPERPEWVAVITGRATAAHQAFLAELTTRIENAGLAKRIMFVGERPHIERWYQAIDLFVAPQRWEGFGLTPLEAMASGAAVVATDVGAFDEILDATGTGQTVPAGDIDALTERISILMDDPGILHRMAQTGLEKVREAFPLEREAGRLIEIYYRLGARKTGRRTSEPSTPETLP